MEAVKNKLQFQHTKRLQMSQTKSLQVAPRRCKAAIEQRARGAQADLYPQQDHTTDHKRIAAFEFRGSIHGIVFKTRTAMLPVVLSITCMWSSASHFAGARKSWTRSQVWRPEKGSPVVKAEDANSDELSITWKNCASA